MEQLEMLLQTPAKGTLPKPQGIVPEIKISYHPVVKPSQLVKVTTSKETYRLLLDKWNLDTIDLFEEFKLVVLNRAGRVKGIFTVGTGGYTSVIADIRLVLLVAIKELATSIIIVHNHPSGCLVPSKADEALTQKLKMAVSYFDIKLLDHIIVTSEEYYSMADNGMI